MSSDWGALKLIGHGQFPVYKGNYLGSVAAFKKISGYGGIQSVTAELNIVRIQQHAHIVGFYGLVQAATNGNLREYYLITEYCKNGDFQQLTLCRNVEYSVSHVIRWGRQLFDALVYLETEQILHRDLKPQNVLLGDKNEVKIADFGLSKLEKPSTSMSGMSTKRYMPPEACVCEIGGTRIFTFKSDVYSGGLVVWEIVERRKVFGEYEEDVVYCEIAKKSLQLEDANCFLKLKNLIKRCSDLEMIDRPSASECVAEFTTMEKSDIFEKFKGIELRKDCENENVRRPIGINEVDDEFDVVNILLHSSSLQNCSENDELDISNDEQSAYQPKLPFEITRRAIDSSRSDPQETTLTTTVTTSNNNNNNHVPKRRPILRNRMQKAVQMEREENDEDLDDDVGNELDVLNRLEAIVKPTFEDEDQGEEPSLRSLYDRIDSLRKTRSRSDEDAEVEEINKMHIDHLN